MLKETGVAKETLRNFLQTLKGLYRIVDPVYRLAIIKYM